MQMYWFIQQKMVSTEIYLDIQLFEQILIENKKQRIITMVDLVKHGSQQRGIKMIQRDQQFVVLQYLLDVEQYSQISRVINKVVLLISTFVVVSNANQQSIFKYLYEEDNYNKQLLPNCYIIQKSDEKQELIEHYKSFNQTNHIILDNDQIIQNVQYIIDNFLINNYFNKQLYLEQFNQQGLYEFIVEFSFRILNKLNNSDEDYLEKQAIKVKDQNYLFYKYGKMNIIKQYEKDITKMFNEMIELNNIQKVQDNHKLFDVVQSQLENKYINQVKLGFMNMYDYTLFEEIKNKFVNKFKSICEQYKNKYIKYSEFFQNVNEQFQIITQKLNQNNFSNYEEFEQNLMIFKNFCQQQIIDKRDSTHLQIAGDFIYEQNKLGALHFINKLEQQIQQQQGQQVTNHDTLLNSQMTQSMDEFSFNEEEMKQSAFIQDIQQNNLLVSQLFDQIGFAIYSINGGDDSKQNSKAIQELKDTWATFQIKFKNLEISVKNNIKLIRNQKKMIRKLKMEQNMKSNRKESRLECQEQSKIVELETELEQNRYIQSSEKELFLKKESEYIKQIQNINKLTSRLYEKSLENQNQTQDTHEELIDHYQKQLKEQKIAIQQLEEENDTKLEEIKDMKRQMDDQKAIYRQQVQQIELQNQDLKQKLIRNQEFLKILEDNQMQQQKETTEQTYEEIAKESMKKSQCSLKGNENVQIVIKYETMIQELQKKIEGLVEEKRLQTKQIQSIFDNYIMSMTRQQKSNKSDYSEMYAQIKNLQNQLRKEIYNKNNLNVRLDMLSSQKSRKLDSLLIRRPMNLQDSMLKVSQKNISSIDCLSSTSQKGSQGLFAQSVKNTVSTKQFLFSSRME